MAKVLDLIVSLLLLENLLFGSPKTDQCFSYIQQQKNLASQQWSNLSKSEGTVRGTEPPIFFKILKEGTGADLLSDNDSPIVSFEVNEWGENGDKNPLIQDKPKKIDLKYCIPGIQAGMRGMKQGEKRRIFIHPSLGHGEYNPLILYGITYYDIEVVSLNKSNNK